MAEEKKSKSLKSFESALKELESIVERMEQGEQTLEKSLSDFERGISLSQKCQNDLKNAEIRIEKIVNKNKIES